MTIKSQEYPALKLPDRIWYFLIAFFSVAVVTVVLLMFYSKKAAAASPDPGIYILPKINAFINAACAVFLTLGYFFIRKKNMRAHRFFMIGAFILSGIFFTLYLAYHSMAPDTHFGGTGTIRGVYFFLLLTHILLAASIVPLSLLTLYRVWRNRIESHRRIARWTFPIWLYVSVSGVAVYLLISPYYPS